MQSRIEQNIEVEYANGESLTIAQAIANIQGEDQGLRYYAAW